jgi:5-formyltetrahydrofolate cyclo-ligase
MDHVALKKELRKKLNTARKALSEEEVREKSEAIFRNWKQAFAHLDPLSAIHIFQSIGARREPDTSFFKEYLHVSCPDTRIVIPVVEPGGEKLIHVELAHEIEMVNNRWGIPEPRAPWKAVTAKVPDMVLVPLLGFDDKGHRLGYGKGHYDRRTQPCFASPVSTARHSLRCSCD